MEHLEPMALLEHRVLMEQTELRDLLELKVK
jgi:hypothetical protein